MDAGFDAGPPAASLCGFAIPTIRFKFGFNFNLPGFSFPPKLPIPYLSLGLNCDLNNPLDLSAGLKPGGGRTSNAPPSPDMNENAA